MISLPLSVLLIIKNKQSIEYLDEWPILEAPLEYCSIITNTLEEKTKQQLSTWLQKISVHYELYELNEEKGATIETGIDYFFEHHTAGCILESNCIPQSTFFTYCTELLPKYQHNTHILEISGINFLNYSFTSNSYFFSNTFHATAFATWKDRWQLYKTLVFPEQITHRCYHYYGTKINQDWRYRWAMFSCFDKYLSIIPRENLIQLSSEMNEPFKYYHFLSDRPMKFPLQHPHQQTVDVAYQKTMELDFFNPLMPFEQEKLAEKNIKINLKILSQPDNWYVSETYTLTLKITNKGQELFASLQPYPIHLSYHWVDLNEETYHIFDGVRTPLASHENQNVGGFRAPSFLFLLPNETRIFSMKIVTPQKQGQYLLRITLVQERHTWFDEISADNKKDIEINVMDKLCILT